MIFRDSISIINHIEILYYLYTKSQAMKTPYLLIPLSLLFLLLPFLGQSQCDPMTGEQCPDPENNGQVCPDSLVPGYLHQFYSQVATIKPPAVYYKPPDSTVVPLHHVKLMEVGNLPPGLSWQSNTTDSNFVAGQYYCVLMEGQPQAIGDYPLKIKVGVYVIILQGWDPVWVGDVVDSTSLMISIYDDSGIPGINQTGISSTQASPNPFRDQTNITFVSDKPGQVSFEVFTLTGEKIFGDAMMSQKGENELIFNGQNLSPGSYLYVIRSGDLKTSGILVKEQR